jgi:hypothetical protein
VSKKPKAEMIRIIGEQLDTFSDAFQLSGLEKDHLFFNAELFDSLKVEYIQDAYAWMQRILRDFYYPFKRFYRQRKPEYWANLTIFYDDPHEFPEYRELVKRAKAFRRAVTKAARPRVFKKNEVEKLAKGRRSK